MHDVLRPIIEATDRCAGWTQRLEVQLCKPTSASDQDNNLSALKKQPIFSSLRNKQPRSAKHDPLLLLRTQQSAVNMNAHHERRGTPLQTRFFSPHPLDTGARHSSPPSERSSKDSTIWLVTTSVYVFLRLPQVQTLSRITLHSFSFSNHA